ncbi:MAG: ABC transporter substrate-binding protein [Acidobacteria bacterium]|nr:ABC transporter substrate-binding protein [Acidobacteriota bacterium]
MGRKNRGWLFALGAAALAVALAFALRFLSVPGRQDSSPPPPGATAPRRGGELVVAIRSDPPTFNRYANAQLADNTVEAITHLLHAKLARIDRQTGELVPWLAERWTESADHLTYTVTLRDGVKWSDGHPFTADDVRFSFEAAYDARLNSSLRSSMLVRGKPLAVSAPDARTVVLAFPSPFGPGLRILDNMVIFPRHRLEASLRAGTMGEAWGPSANPAEIAGLGPFRLVSYTPAERIVFERNPHYFRHVARGTSHVARDASHVARDALPYLDRLTLVVVRDQSTEVLRLLGGQVDISAREIRPEDYATLRREESQGRVALADAGTGLDPNMLWFNLSPPAFRGDPRKPWLQSETFRKAISHAVDRKALVDQVYLGAGVPIDGPVTPGNKEWYVEDLPRYELDRSRARELLAGLGLTDRNGDGMLEDAAGRAVRFSILTQQQDTIRMRTASVLQEQLRQSGIAVDVVGVDPGSIVQRWAASDYDAIYFGVEASSHDPANNLDFWLSSGSFHVWNAGQKSPATEWEARIDALIEQQISTTDGEERRRLYAEVQRIFAEHLPILYFAAPRLIVAMTPRVANARPAPLKPLVLWSADTLAVK